MTFLDKLFKRIFHLNFSLKFLC